MKTKQTKKIDGDQEYMPELSYHSYHKIKLILENKTLSV